MLNSTSLPTVLEGIDVWDGISHLGSTDLHWEFTSADAVISRVTPTDTPARGGLTLIPGLIDTHVHLIGNASSTPSDFLTWPLVTRPEEQVLHGLAHAQQALAVGVTTLRDLSADDVQFSLGRGINKGLIAGPRIFAHGMVSMTGGHGDMFVPPGVDPSLRRPTADGPDACRSLVRTWARAGATGIKIATSGGLLSDGDKPSWRNHTRAEIDAIIDEAHALGMLVAAHAHTREGIRIAIEAGADSIEHATDMTEDLAHAIAAAGTPIAPTLLINDAIATRRVPVSEDQAEAAATLVHSRDAQFAVAAEAEVNFVLGTDANGFHVGFGDQLAEVRKMAEVFGWSAERALQSATSRAAAAIGRADALGRIIPGAAADFVIVRGRPWEDISDLDTARIVTVVSRGRVVSGELPR
ncbi:amidohydrolase family protein [Mycetocola sp. JXN-3]|uniref:metal-dependent hydrolase family protein n=1 Tax=Mycetocola sp. JXN-3 TaxID=2116510 RepID=UPI00165D298E|nr:amidohydrolase family protein [Mycetocola sp. JXN-3]